MRASQVTRFAAFVLSVIIAFSLFCLKGLCARGGLSRSNEARIAQSGAELALSCNVYGDTVEVVLELSSSTGVCGLFARLCYPPRSLVLLYCCVDEYIGEGFNFECFEQNGGVVFLLDSYKNCEPNSKLARFYFKRTTSEAIDAELCLVTVSDRACYYIQDENILPLDIDLSKCQVTARLEGETSDEMILQRPYLWELLVEFSGDRVRLTAWGKIQSNQHFAVGFKIFTVYLDEARTECVTLSKISDGKQYELCTHIENSGNICIIVTPIVYSGDSIVEGEKYSFVIK